MNVAIQTGDGGSKGTVTLRQLLLIESEADQAIYWSSLLSSLGFVVTCASNLARAQEQLTLKPDLIVCAARLRDGRGCDFSRVSAEVMSSHVST